MEVTSEGGAKGVRGWALRARPESVFMLGLVIVFPSDLSSCGQDFFFFPRGSQQYSTDTQSGNYSSLQERLGEIKWHLQGDFHG